MTSISHQSFRFEAILKTLIEMPFFLLWRWHQIHIVAGKAMLKTIMKMPSSNFFQSERMVRSNFADALRCPRLLSEASAELSCSDLRFTDCTNACHVQTCSKLWSCLSRTWSPFLKGMITSGLWNPYYGWIFGRFLIVRHSSPRHSSPQTFITSDVHYLRHLSPPS